jgi:hypothetical protein
MAIKSKIKGKKKHVNKPTSKKYTKYTIESGKITKKARSCPRCGPGIFLSVLLSLRRKLLLRLRLNFYSFILS